MPICLPSEELIAALGVLGVDTQKARRVIIDVSLDSVVVFHVEQYAEGEPKDVVALMNAIKAQKPSFIELAGKCDKCGGPLVR